MDFGNGTKENPGANANPNGRAQWGLRTIAAVAVCFLIGGFYIGTEFAGNVPWAHASPVSDVPDGADLAPLFKAWELLDRNFVSTATTTATTTKQDKIWGAISGLTDSYGDPYTTFLPPKEKNIFESQVQGNFGGVGMEIDIKDGKLVVVAPLKDTPAYNAGVKTGDVIEKIEGEDTATMTVDDAVNKIRGPVGTDVTVTFSRDGGKPYDVKITRDTINLPTVDSKLLPSGVFDIQVYAFNAQAPDKFREALRAFAESGSDKLIVDLRGNPGGYLEAAVDMVSWFLPVGSPIVIQDSGDKAAQETYRSRGYDAFNNNLKMAILIDGGSASAAEIFAGALHDHNVATLVGEKSFGKGSVQQVFDVTSDASIKITIARWLTPNGSWISHQGIAPDITVDRTADDVKAQKDPQLDRAVEFLTTGK